MNKTRVFTLVLGIFNIIAGLILVTFVIMMQNILAFFLGILYVIFGIALFTNKVWDKLLWGIIPLTILYSENIIMLSVYKDIPEPYQMPLPICLLFILPLWAIIWGNIYVKWLGRKN